MLNHRKRRVKNSLNYSKFDTNMTEFAGDQNTAVKYATNIVDDYYYHSILYDGKDLYVKDSRLGVAISHGCVRLATENAK